MYKECKCGKKMILWFDKHNLLFRDDYFLWQCKCGEKEYMGEKDLFDLMWNEVNK